MKNVSQALYIVPTPIGNLEDMTIRGLNVLRSADIIACEDTRVTGKLLKMLEITPKRLLSYHEHNEEARSGEIIEFIRGGASVALVSDAGSPCISDPGTRLARRAISAGLRIIPLPGPSALLPAIMASGFAARGFVFVGFPPHKKGRRTFIEKILDQEYDAAVYESVHRIGKLLREIIELGGGDRQICLAREISKLHEEFMYGTVSECRERLQAKHILKGEFVLVIEGRKD